MPFELALAEVGMDMVGGSLLSDMVGSALTDIGGGMFLDATGSLVDVAGNAMGSEFAGGLGASQFADLAGPGASLSGAEVGGPWSPQPPPSKPYGGLNDWGNIEPSSAARSAGSQGFSDSLKKFQKDNPLLLPAAGALAQAYGNSRNRSTTSAMSDQARKDMLARQSLNDSPPQASWAGSPGLNPQTLASNPLALTQNSGYGTSRMPAEHAFFKANGGALDIAHGTGVAPHAGGLEMHHAYVKDHGAGGQDDNVPAMLSSKEYVMDADTVAALGDGNPDHGARKLDEWRKNLRAHKRSAPTSKIPPKARSVESYLRKVA